MQESRVALLAIVVENPDAVGELNELLHAYGAYIIGRMGLPYPKRRVNLMSIMLDAPGDVISALSGKVGRLEGVSSKVVYSKLEQSAGGDEKRQSKETYEGNGVYIRTLVYKGQTVVVRFIKDAEGLVDSIGTAWVK